MIWKDLIVKRTLGKVSGVDISLDRDVFLSAWIHFDFGGTRQGFGGFCFDSPAPKDKDGILSGERIGAACGADWIRRVMRVFNVTNFQDIIGKAAYACYEKDKWGESILGIEPLDYENTRDCPPFYISEWRAYWFPQDEKGETS